jgi:hypothetical protein
MRVKSLVSWQTSVNGRKFHPVKCVKCAVEIPDSATSHLCPSSATEAGRKRQLIRPQLAFGAFAVLFIVAVLIAIFSTSTSSQPDTSSQASPGSAASTSGQPDTNYQPPKDESEFISAISSFRARYAEAANEFQKSALRRERAKAIATILPSLSIQNWVGKISVMTDDSDGDGLLYVELTDGLTTIEITNNSFSNIAEHRLISHGSSLHSQLADFAIGDVVVFSGRFASGDADYIGETLQTVPEEESMDRPQFAFTFTSIGKSPSPVSDTVPAQPAPPGTVGE